VRQPAVAASQPVAEAAVAVPEAAVADAPACRQPVLVDRAQQLRCVLPEEARPVWRISVLAGLFVLQADVKLLRPC